MPSTWVKHAHEILLSVWDNHMALLSPKVVSLTCGTFLISSVFPPDCSVFQFQTKTLFSFFYCLSVYLLNNNFIILNLNLFHMEKLILGVKKAAHNKVGLLSMTVSSHFFHTLMLKLKCIRKQKCYDVLFI